MSASHRYELSLNWTGNIGTGTSHYRAYERSYTVQVINKPDILGSADPQFRGDATKYNPEEFLVAALSSCHMLSYLHLCAVNGVVVTGYEDKATGLMEETPDGGGHFVEVVLQPLVTVTEEHMVERAKALHHRASELCFIANSVNFPVHHRPECQVKK